MTDETLPIEGFSASSPDSQSGQASVQVPSGPLPFEGIRLYSPITIALYSFLANLPLALLLLGLNLGARGRRRLGSFVILIAAVGTLWLLSTIGDGISRKPTEWIVDLVIAWALYKIEKPPYLDALAKGAVTARWWVPGVWLLVFIFLGLVYIFSRQ